MQEEEEDSEEDVKRLEDNLEALAILKDYTSPWPLDADGLPIVATTAGDAQDGRGGQRARTVAPSGTPTCGNAAREVGPQDLVGMSDAVWSGDESLLMAIQLALLLA